MIELKNFDIQIVENKEVISNAYKVFIENYFSDFVIEQQKEFVDRQLLITFQNYKKVKIPSCKSAIGNFS